MSLLRFVLAWPGLTVCCAQQSKSKGGNRKERAGGSGQDDDDVDQDGDGTDATAGSVESKDPAKKKSSKSKASKKTSKQLKAAAEKKRKADKKAARKLARAALPLVVLSDDQPQTDDQAETVAAARSFINSGTVDGDVQDFFASCRRGEAQATSEQQLFRCAQGKLLLKLAESKTETKTALLQRQRINYNHACQLEKYAEFCREYKGAVLIGVPWSKYFRRCPDSERRLRWLKRAIDALLETDSVAYARWTTAPDWNE